MSAKKRVCQGGFSVRINSAFVVEIISKGQFESSLAQKFQWKKTRKENLCKWKLIKAASPLVA